MSVTIIGDGSFRDIDTPAKSKNEWGIDVLTRRMQGAASLLTSFISGLAQAQTYQSFYLQTWSDDRHPVKPTVTLVYKGLINGIPQPLKFNDIVPATGSTSANFADENGGAGYQYGIDSDGNPLYALSAVREFAYYCPQTLWRYIAQGQPNGPQYGSLGFIRSAELIKSRIVTSDGAVFGGNAPAGLVSALAVEPETVTIGFRSEPVVGTPYFECEDLVVSQFPSS